MRSHLHRLILVVLFASGVYGCTIDERITLNRMYGHKVLFPDSFTEICHGERIYNSSIPGSINRFIVYFGEKECSACHASRMWEYCDLATELSGEGTLPIFIFADSSKTEEAQELVLNSSFPFSVYFDKSNIFIRGNKFIPKNSKYHTFLIDKNSKIVFVGNPAFNDKIALSLERVIQTLRPQE